MIHVVKPRAISKKFNKEAKIINWEWRKMELKNALYAKDVGKDRKNVKKDWMRQVENEYQGSRFKSNHIHNHI